MSAITMSCMLEPDILRLDAFESQYHVQVEAQNMTWDSAWDELLRIALYGQGPDVSEIGSTWLSSLIDMQAIRPLTSWDLGFLRAQERFFPAARWAVIKPGDYRVWAVPWYTDTRVIYYRRGWLKQAGVEEATAFETTASLVSTLERLQTGGIDVPWAMPSRGLDVVYTAASWVWEAGGHFRTRDGRHLRLHEPEALAGLRSYFELHRFLAPPAQGLDAMGIDALFREGKVAALVSGPWLMGQLAGSRMSLSNVGVVPVPGIPFVGGSHLVIWRHARDERSVIRLMQYLTSPELQRHCFQQMGILPSRLEVLDEEPFISEPHYRAFASSLKTGRVMTISYRWTAVEQRLVHMLSQLWSDLADNPQLDLEDEIDRRIAALGEDFERTILAKW